MACNEQSKGKYTADNSASMEYILKDSVIIFFRICTKWVMKLKANLDQR